jgi:formate dehydrogenase maturation protein FdhE
MTPQEAIEILQHEHDYAQLLSYVNAALTTAIKALEKQIPKKVKNKQCDYGICPVCGHSFFGGMEYCSKCGQALDWS